MQSLHNHPLAAVSSMAARVAAVGYLYQSADPEYWLQCWLQLLSSSDQMCPALVQGSSPSAGLLVESIPQPAQKISY